MEEQQVELLLLHEQCAYLEDRVLGILPKLEEQDRQTIECYIQMRDDLEVFLINKAIRFGKRHGM